MAIDLRTTPKEKQRYDICLESVKADGKQLAYVSEAYQTEELCLEAVRQNSMFLEYVKEQTPAICLAAVRQNG